MMLMRLHRALAGAGVASRRKAEDLIRAGRVRVDGAVATIGMSVDPLRQRVTVDGRAVRAAGPVTWLALNKPVGYVVSRGDPEGRSEEHTSELQSQSNLVCRLLLEKKKKNNKNLACKG